MFYKNEIVKYRGRKYRVMEVGEDGSLTLDPIEQPGCGWNRSGDFGEVEVAKENLNEVCLLLA